jgi:hypothetical protein
MSNLQLSLILLGGVVLALIVGYNTWTNRRNTPKRADPRPSAFQSGDADGDGLATDRSTLLYAGYADRTEPAFDSPLMHSSPRAHQGVEPTMAGVDAHASSALTPDGKMEGDAVLLDTDEWLGSSTHAQVQPSQQPGVSIAPVVSRTPSTNHTIDPLDALRTPVPYAATPTAIERRGALDALIDAIAPIHLDQPVSGEAAVAALPTTRRAGSKPFAVEAFNATTQQWEWPAAGQRYLRFQAGVQLANRTGALNEIEFSEFVVKTQAFADALHAMVDLPDMLQEVARARELDQFASEHDAQLTFMVRARKAAWSVGYLLQNAARAGLVAGSLPGRLVLPSGTPGMPALVALSYDSQAALADDIETSIIRDISLGLDVAQAHRNEQPLARLREVAVTLCDAMDGVLCDQTGQPIADVAIDPIAQDLEHLYDQLDSHDLSAGSFLARRLFS